MSRTESAQNKGNVLAYFACGPIDRIPVGDFSPYDTVVLVDRHLGLDKLENHPNRDELLSGRFILLQTDAIAAVDVLQCMSVRLDAYLAWNEGIYGGGGDYHLNGRYFLKYLSQIVSDRYMHVHNEHYFRIRQRKKGAPTLPFTRSDSDVASRCELQRIIHMFSNAGHWAAKEAEIHSMERLAGIPDDSATRFPNITLTRGNIWDDTSLDMLFLPMKWLPSKYVYMRRPDPGGPGYLPMPSAPNIRFPRQVERYPEVWSNQRLERCLMERYTKRYGIEEEGITKRVLHAVEGARKGSRIGLMDWGYTGSDLRKLSKAASESGSTIVIFSM
jgi:hypothetical protein